MEKDTRTKLIEIATEMFATKGFSAVSVREITTAANVNVSAISYYFDSKEGLYQTILKEQLTPILQALRSVQGNALFTPIRRLTSYADQIARINMQRPFLARLMTNEITNPTEYGGQIVEKHISQMYEFMAAALQDGMANGDFRRDLNIGYTAISLAGIINFYFITRPINQKFIPLTEKSNEEYVAHAFRGYLYGITNPKKVRSEFD
ncbi:MAG: transcriptional regulator, TetR family [Firmicutes bacterium]|nr:transcriptional regulator, TetR family [Bacillota bacterium]